MGNTGPTFRPLLPREPFIYGAPILRTVVLVDLQLAIALAHAVKAYRADPDQDELLEVLKQFINRALPRLVSGQWLGAARRPQVGSSWFSLQSGDWLGVDGAPCIAWANGRLSFHGSERVDVRVRPASPVPLELALLAFCENYTFSQLLSAIARGDGQEQGWRLAAVADLLTRVAYGHAWASCIQGNDRVGLPATDLHDFSLEGSTIRTRGLEFRDVQFWLGDPFAEPSPIPVEVTNWPDRLQSPAENGEGMPPGGAPASVQEESTAIDARAEPGRPSKGRDEIVKAFEDRYPPETEFPHGRLTEIARDLIDDLPKENRPAVKTVTAWIRNARKPPKTKCSKQCQKL